MLYPEAVLKKICSGCLKRNERISKMCFLCFRFVVRDFVYDEEELAASKNEISRLTSDKKKLFVSCSSQNLFRFNNYYIHRFYNFYTVIFITFYTAKNEELPLLLNFKMQAIKISFVNAYFSSTVFVTNRKEYYI